jgi:nucleotide-binding universal stress UspA family protein
VRSILSGVDFSEQSRHALRWAGTLAAKFQRRLIVISVIDPLLAEAARIRLGLDLAATEIEPALREFVAATWPTNTPTAEVILKTPVGDTAAAILETGAAEGVELIAAGTRGLGGFQKWLLGSTTERLLRRTRVPVLAVPPPDAPESDVLSPSGTIQVGRVLAATDFSEVSLAAIEYAAQLSRLFSAKLILAHAVEPSTVSTQWRSIMEEAAEMRAAEARHRLKSVAEQLSLSPECEVVTSVGRAADVMSALAADHRVQLIVMGLASSGGAFAPRPGSIAYRVLTGSTVPVLVVPAEAVQE